MGICAERVIIDKESICQNQDMSQRVEDLSELKSRSQLIRFLENKGAKNIKDTLLEECYTFQLLRTAREWNGRISEGWNERISDNLNKTRISQNQDMPQRLEDLIALKQAGKEVHLLQILKKKTISLENDHGLLTAKTLFFAEFSGDGDGKPFSFEKEYIYGDGQSQNNGLSRCLLIANQRLRRDYKRLKAVGISIKEKSFTLKDFFVGLSADYILQTPIPTLDDFISLSKTGVSIEVEAKVHRCLKIESVNKDEKWGFCYSAVFWISYPNGEVKVEKIYSQGFDEDPKKAKDKKLKIANQRLMRDIGRLKKTGITVKESKSENQNEDLLRSQKSLSLISTHPSLKRIEDGQNISH